MSGYIKDGRYYRGEPPQAFLRGRTSVYKGADHDRQRREHKAELVQPYNKDGSPNQEFIHLYPKESKVYGFIKVEGEENGKSKE